MHTDTILPLVVGVSLIILIIGFILKYFKQPLVVGYILAGMLIGPFGLKLITDEGIVSHLGEIGVVFILFFAGMEICFPCIVSNWRISIFGTVLQIIASIGIVWLIGGPLGWSLNRTILIGFVISLSSTALVIKLLQEKKELGTKIGENVTGILIMQDFAVVLMLIILNFLGGQNIRPLKMGFEIIGGILILVLLYYLIPKKGFNIPFGKHIKKDHEIQVFVALILCFGLAFLTQLIGLSSALGAFVAGVIIASSSDIQWVHTNLHPFRVVFVAVFFASIGILIDLNFLRENLRLILLLVGVVFLVNTFINGAVLKFLGNTWKESIYSGALLSQIGEFSFVLGATGLQIGLISKLDHQTIISVISLTLLFSPAWIMITKRLTCKDRC